MKLRFDKIKFNKEKVQRFKEYTKRKFNQFMLLSILSSPASPVFADSPKQSENPTSSPNARFNNITPLLSDAGEFDMAFAFAQQEENTNSGGEQKRLEQAYNTSVGKSMIDLKTLVGPENVEVTKSGYASYDHALKVNIPDGVSQSDISFAIRSLRDNINDWGGKTSMILPRDDHYIFRYSDPTPHSLSISKNAKNISPAQDTEKNTGQQDPPKSSSTDTDDQNAFVKQKTNPKNNQPQMNIQLTDAEKKKMLNDEWLMQKNDQLYDLLSELRSVDPDNLDAIYSIYEQIADLHKDVQYHLQTDYADQLTSTDITEQMTLFWKNSLDGVPKDFLFLDAFRFKDDFDVNTDSQLFFDDYIRSVITVQKLNEFLINSINESVPKQVFQNDLQEYTRRLESLNIRYQDADTGPLEAAIVSIYGNDAMALHGLMNELGIVPVEGSAYKNLISLTEHISSNIEDFQARWSGFSAQFTLSSAMITSIAEKAFPDYDGDYNTRAIAISDNLHNDIFPGQQIYDRRPAIDAFAAISLSRASTRNDQFSLMNDVDLYNYLEHMATLPAGTAVLLTQNDKIMTDLLLSNPAPGQASGRFKYGVDEINRVYSTLRNIDTKGYIQDGKLVYDDRFVAIDELLNFWLTFSDQGSKILPHLKNESLTTRNKQIQILDPRSEILRGFGSMDNTFQARMLARFHLGHYFLDERDIFRQYGNVNLDRSVSAAANWNQSEFDRFFNTMPSGWYARTSWNLPPLHLRMDDQTYFNDFRYAVNKIIDSRTPKTTSFRSADFGAQSAWTPLKDQQDLGARFRGTKYGEYLMGGFSRRDVDTYQDDVGKTMNVTENAARVAGQNLYTQGAGIRDAFAEWYRRDQDNYVDYNGDEITLKKINETAIGDIDLKLYDADVIIGGYHNYRKDQELNGDNLTTDEGTRTSPNRDDLEVYVRLPDGWYQLDFKSRKYNSLTKDLQTNNKTVNSDGLLEHTFFEGYQKMSGFLEEANAAWEHQRETEIGINNDHSLHGYYIGLKFDGEFAGLRAQSMDGEKVTTLGKLFGDPDNISNATLLYSSVFELKQYKDAYGLHGSYQNYEKPRTYRFGEQNEREGMFNDDMVIMRAVLQDVNTAKYEAFAGKGKLEGTDDGIVTAGGSAYGKITETEHAGFGAFFTYDNGQPVEAYMGTGYNGGFIGLKTSATGFYYNRELNDKSYGLYGWSVHSQLSDGLTLFSNAYVNPDALTNLGRYSDQRITGIKTNINSLKTDIQSNWSIFTDDTKMASAISLGRDWGNRLFSIDSQLQYYLLTDPLGARTAEYSAGIKTPEGLYKLGYSTTESGDELSMFIAPDNNWAFFASKINKDDYYGGLKHSNDSKDMAFAGVYGKIEGQDLAAVQAMFKDVGGVSVMGGDEYFRISGVAGNRKYNLLIDYRNISDLEGFGITGRYRAAMGLNMALGLNLLDVKGTDFSSKSIKGELSYPVGTGFLGLGYYHTFLPENMDWGYLRLTGRFRF